jgi:hypothetical protein
MFINLQDAKKKEYYQKMLGTVGSLSRLFSESNEPYLHYRIAENLFCKSFGAENLSRSDTSADASLNRVGFGLKTFLQGNGRKMEKVAEFNNDSPQFRVLSPEEQVGEIVRIRNERIETTKRIYGLDEIIYHCVARTKGRMSIIETPMHLIDIDSLKIKNKTSKSVSFQDKYEEYSFNYSKSTLFKKFLIENALIEVPVSIIEDPFEVLERLNYETAHDVNELVFPRVRREIEHVFLPLYSTRSTESKDVPERSGLNQWNAGGRTRSLGEVYIPIPAFIHKKFPNFFPEKDVQFNLHLPNKNILTAKVCQGGKKALMTNPNEALGQWILRDVLKLKEGELLTYQKLEDINLDSVVIYKVDEENFHIDFAKIGSYDSFFEGNK